MLPLFSIMTLWFGTCSGEACAGVMEHSTIIGRMPKQNFAHIFHDKQKSVPTAGRTISFIDSNKNFTSLSSSILVNRR